MSLNVNMTEFSQLAQDFYNTTKMLIVLYDDKRRLLFSYPQGMCAFCTEVRKNKELSDKCILYDTSAFDTCMNTKQLYIYTCHMGLIEAVAPIIENNNIIGYMMLGQITNKKNKKELIRIAAKTANEYNLDKKSLLKGLDKVKYVSNNKIESIARIMEMCACYIWLKGIVSVKAENYSYHINKYIEENLCEDLSIPAICAHFFISKSFLYNISKNYFKSSIAQYVKLKRLNKAKELLLDNNLLINEVSARVGIEDENYFTKIFKNHMGLTPRDYRKNNCF